MSTARPVHDAFFPEHFSLGGLSAYQKLFLFGVHFLKHFSIFWWIVVLAILGAALSHVFFRYYSFL